MSVDPVTAYALSVRSGETVAGRLVRLACERRLRDRKNAAAKGWTFDVAAVDRAIKFFKHLRHSKGEWADQPLVLAPWQEFVVGSLIGWKRADGLRRFGWPMSKSPGRTARARCRLGSAFIFSYSTTTRVPRSTAPRPSATRRRSSGARRRGCGTRALTCGSVSGKL
jgi:hypothetical protein